MKDTLVIGGHEFQSRFILGSGKYSLDLNANAPENWDGIIEISYFIKNAGSGALAKFTAA